MLSITVSLVIAAATPSGEKTNAAVVERKETTLRR